MNVCVNCNYTALSSCQFLPDNDSERGLLCSYFSLGERHDLCLLVLHKGRDCEIFEKGQQMARGLLDLCIDSNWNPWNIKTAFDLAIDCFCHALCVAVCTWVHQFFMCQSAWHVICKIFYLATTRWCVISRVCISDRNAHIVWYYTASSSLLHIFTAVLNVNE